MANVISGPKTRLACCWVWGHYIQLCQTRTACLLLMQQIVLRPKSFGLLFELFCLVARHRCAATSLSEALRMVQASGVNGASSDPSLVQYEVLSFRFQV